MEFIQKQKLIRLIFYKTILQKVCYLKLFKTNNSFHNAPQLANIYFFLITTSINNIYFNNNQFQNQLIHNFYKKFKRKLIIQTIFFFLTFYIIIYFQQKKIKIKINKKYIISIKLMLMEQITDQDSITTQDSEQQQQEQQEYRLYNNQVGGHHTILCPKSCNDYIIKPAKKKELQFYEKMQQNREDNKLAQFLPKYYGTTDIKESAKIIIQEAIQENNNNLNNDIKQSENFNSNEEHKRMKWLQNLFKEKYFYGRSLKLQNLTKDYKYPCVLDIKMGFSAPSEKHKEKFLNSTSSSHGFRICGLNVYWDKSKKTIFKDKYWGRQIKSEDLNISMAYYFYNGEQLRISVIKKLIIKLQKLKEALEIYKGFLFKSSSLLIVYDGQQPINQTQQQHQSMQLCNLKSKKSLVSSSDNLSIDSNKEKIMSKPQSQEFDVPVTLKLIDFGNIEYTNSNRTDNELIDGITNLIDCLKNIITWENMNLEFNNLLKEQKQKEIQTNCIA